MNEDQLRSFIERQESRASNPTIEYEQAMAMDYYLRRPFGNEEEGRSEVVSSDVWDVVEGMTPILLKPFVSSSDVVQFNAVGPEDEEAAKQETDYLNYVVTQKNDSFTQLTMLAKAGLLQKNGVAKYWWDQTRRVSIETYREQSEDMVAAWLQDENIQIIEQTQNPGATVIGPETGEAVQGPPTYDIKLRATETDGLVKFRAVTPESLLVIGDDPNPQNASFLQHREKKTISDLREMGYEVDDHINDSGSGETYTSVQAAARSTDGLYLQDANDGGGDPSMREVWVRETYCRVDFDGDGVAELRKVCMVGSTVLANEEVEEIQFVGWTPYLQLFQFYGRCPADEAIEIQDIKSTLWRQTLDNIYTINNNRVFAGKLVNLDDLMDNQIAGVVRVNADVVGNQVMSMPVQPLGAIIQPMIEYADSAKENRTGWTRYSQGMDADSLNKTATGVRLIQQAGNERLALIQRSLAEQGLKPLMIGIHGLLRRHATKAETVRLRGKWVEIDPRQWKKRYDMTVSVGLGTMDKSMEIAAQQTILAAQERGMQAGIVTPENMYNANAKMVELTGEKAPDKYFTHPNKMPQPQPPDPTQNPEFMLKVKEGEQKDKEISIKEFEAIEGMKVEHMRLGMDQQRVEMDKQRLDLEATKARISALTEAQRLEMDTMNHKREMSVPHAQALAAERQAFELNGAANGKS